MDNELDQHYIESYQLSLTYVFHTSMSNTYCYLCMVNFVELLHGQRGDSIIDPVPVLNPEP